MMHLLSDAKRSVSAFASASKSARSRQVACRARSALPCKRGSSNRQLFRTGSIWNAKALTNLTVVDAIRVLRGKQRQRFGMLEGLLRTIGSTPGAEGGVAHPRRAELFVQCRRFSRLRCDYPSKLGRREYLDLVAEAQHPAQKLSGGGDCRRDARLKI